MPANLAVIHQYAREAMARSGGMILGSDSHTRYGALGTMGVGEGGPELVKQLLMNTYDVKDPEVVLVYLTGAPRPGVGPHDAALQLCEAVYNNGFVKNKVLEFAGPGVKNLPIDFRLGLDVMTTETACLSSVWQTDEAVKDFFLRAGRPGDFKALSPDEGARYDALIEMDLSEVEPMIALPFHPSSALPIAKLLENPGDILREAEIRESLPAGSLTSKVVKGRVLVDQGVIAGCAGGLYDNLAEAAAILSGGSTGCGAFSLSCYPASMPVNLQIVKSGVAEALLEAGAVLKPAFCGPCFGAGDVPFNGGLSIRHATRNFRNREGSKPNEGQLAMVALMDARSIAATARNGGVLTAANQIEYAAPEAGGVPMDLSVYQKRVYNRLGRGEAQGAVEVRPQHRGLAQVWPAEKAPAAFCRLGADRPGDDHRRTDPLRRDLLLPVEPGQAVGIHAVPAGPGLRGPFQGGAGRGVRFLEKPGAPPGGNRLCLGDLGDAARRRLRPGAGGVLSAGVGRGAPTSAWSTPPSATART